MICRNDGALGKKRYQVGSASNDDCGAFSVATRLVKNLVNDFGEWRRQ